MSGAFKCESVHGQLETNVDQEYQTLVRDRNSNVKLMFMAFLFLLRKMFDMDKDNTFSITFSFTALSVYVISCVFFIFLVASLYVVGLTPMRNCFR